MASVWTSLPHTRPTALTTPTLTAGGWAGSGASARPTAVAHAPTFASGVGTAVGTGRSSASILSRVNMRVVSVATTLATCRSRPGTVTNTSLGLSAKLKLLVTM